MIIGFTGTRIGMTPIQWQAVRDLVKDWAINEAHHGLCEGADEEMHWLLRGLSYGPRIDIHGHPPIRQGHIASKRTWSDCNVINTPKEFNVRDKDIVLASSRMIATPFCPEITASGTWTTVRFARKKNKPIWIVMPEGEIITESMNG